VIDTASALALAALLAMAAAPVRAAASDGVVQIAMCGGGSQPVPFHRKERDRDCPGACHAACARTMRGETDEEAD
jgi:hypothetical protein